MTPIVTTISPARHRMRDSRLKLTLVGLGALVSLTGVIALTAYTQARPNMLGLPRGGEFDANRAFADLKGIVSFGPRPPPASRALEQSREFILGELCTADATVVSDSFTTSTPLGSIPKTNIVAKIKGTSSAVVIIAGHYDTKRPSLASRLPKKGNCHAEHTEASAVSYLKLKTNKKQIPLPPWRDRDDIVGGFSTA
jgi:hypothetical protein